ncbi:MAG: patatin-like phospholipase family protein [Candidatus Manganitrophus sp.]|nr:patatin-like phospholipase family protein [Candidatus Manganitrophus sp.]WDT69391.1 MAG: patatin-like phospholipase family protein [Candidatus Manganitrophus sp.]
MEKKEEKETPKGESTQRQDRLGLALSGGGFRASFFHIGVLAQMARLGLLRHVEVISTVSGGSIVGALYYLHVKRLLEAKGDEEVTDQDYIAIITRIEEDFLRGVQQNLRMRTFINPLKALRMALPNYSRSDRIGELYDEYFYRPVLDPNRTTLIAMRELKIQPKGAKPDFNPQDDNDGRRAKAPILLLNATSLNTGHNWRFEAVRMGEPPREGIIAKEIDKNLRLRRPPSYDAITEKQQNIELGLAVAASACVPGLFPPLAISGLYPHDIRVQLVDGGVHDNQGVGGLLDMGCTRFVVSDASGQMRDETQPTTSIPAVLGRANSILMDRVREEELFRLIQHEDAPVAFMHMLRGLSGQAVSWIGPDEKPAEPEKKERLPETTSESFGVDCEVQNLLSRIRTDLDSFSDVEAYALMYDGYKMSEQEIPKCKAFKELLSGSAPIAPPPCRFLEIAPLMAKPTPAFLQQLKVGGERVLKIFRLNIPVAAVTGIVLVGLLFWLWKVLGPTILAQLARQVTIGGLLLSGAILALGFLPVISRVLPLFRFLRGPTSFIVRFVVRALIPAIASGPIALHIFIFDRLFLKQGTLERLGLSSKAGAGGQGPGIRKN